MEPRMDLIGNALGGKIAKRFFAINQLIEQAALPTTLRELVALRASQINGCAPCVDMHTKEAAAGGEDPLRINLTAVWRETGVFSDAERAALALAEEGTRLADAYPGVSDETWAELRKHFDDDQLAALIALVAMINAANRMNVIVRNQGGTYDRRMVAALAG